MAKKRILETRSQELRREAFLASLQAQRAGKKKQAYQYRMRLHGFTAADSMVIYAEFGVARYSPVRGWWCVWGTMEGRYLTDILIPRA